MTGIPKGLRALLPLAALLGAVAGLAILTRDTELVRAIELKTLDWRFRHLSVPARHDPRIVLVSINQASLDRFERDAVYWPWPRSMYIPVLSFLKKGGARAVVFDILFTSPSSHDQFQDGSFGRALKDFGPVVMAMETGAETQALRTEPAAVQFAVAASGALAASASQRRSARLPVPEIAAGARLLGDASAAPDPDGVLRRVSLVVAMGGRFYPSLSAAAAMLATGKTLEELKPPLTDGRLLVRFHGKAMTADPSLKTYESLPIADLIGSWQSIEEGQKPALDPSFFKDKIVFVSGSAPGLLDNHPSPISAVFAGTETVAAAADNLINGDFLTPAPLWVLWAMVLTALLAALAASRLAAHAWAALLTVLATAAALAAVAGYFFTRGVWLDVAAPELALWLGFASVSAYGYAVEGRQKRYIQGAFSHYLSPEIVRQIADNPEKLALGGERRDVTFYFSDIEGFTTISESLPPDKLRALMNRYLGAMTETILQSGGTLDKYIGDAIMAFWGAPLDCAGHALVACKVALANQRTLAALRAELESEGFPPVRNRIGLNSGPASIGNMGSPARFSYTAIGDNVNLASRLEGANKAYGTYILISESTRTAAAEAVEVRELDYVKVKGKNLPIRVYELLGLKGETDARLLEKARLFERGLESFRARRFAEAERLFGDVRREHGDDHASDVYIDRCRRYGLNAPPADWDGSYALTEK